MILFSAPWDDHTAVPFSFWLQNGELSRSAKLTRRDTTMTFTTFVMFDMFNALCCRSADKIVPKMDMFANKAFLYSVGGSLLGQVRNQYQPVGTTVHCFIAYRCLC